MPITGTKRDHPYQRAARKDDLWRHIHEQHGGVPGWQGHYVMAVLRDWHGDMHKAMKVAKETEAELRAAWGDR